MPHEFHREQRLLFQAWTQFSLPFLQATTLSFRNPYLTFQARTQISPLGLQATTRVSPWICTFFRARTKTSPLFLQATTRVSPLVTYFLGLKTILPAISPGYHTSFPLNINYFSRLEHKHPRCFSRLPHEFFREHRLLFHARTQTSPLMIQTTTRVSSWPWLLFQARTQISLLFHQATTRISSYSLLNFPGSNTNIPAISPGYHTSFPVIIN